MQTIVKRKRQFFSNFLII